MKLKLIFLLLIVFGINFSSEAQYRKKGRKPANKQARGGYNKSAAGVFSIGPRVGATLATFDNNPFDEPDEEGEDFFSSTSLGNKPGLQVGAVVNVGLAGFISFQPEFLYVQKGAKASATFDQTDTDGPYTLVQEGNFNYELKTAYFEAPLLLKASFGTSELSGFVTAGPTLGYWHKGNSHTKGSLKGTLTYNDGTNEQSISEEEDFDEKEKVDFGSDEDGKEKRFETGLSLGVGMGYRLGPGTLNLDIRYGIGLSGINVPREEGENTFKNRVIGVSIAYLFSL